MSRIANVNEYIKYIFLTSLYWGRLEWQVKHPTADIFVGLLLRGLFKTTNSLEMVLTSVLCFR